MGPGSSQGYVMRITEWIVVVSLSGAFAGISAQESAYPVKRMGTHDSVGWRLEAPLCPASAGDLCQPVEQSIPDTVLVPGLEYGMGGFLRYFAGQGYRRLWTVPIRVEIADLSQLEGGLTPFRIGGGMTTQTLHLRSDDGRRFVFRSVNKYAGRGLEEELRGTVYESVLQDQISSFHPSGALMVSPLLDAVDVLHTEPRLYFLPDDPQLGEFREHCANLLMLFEERPDEGPNDTPGFAGSRMIVGTPGLFDELEDDPRNQLDTHAYLRARLVDLLVGDRDRSVNNWLWARFERGDGYVWQPIPRDRDQAFIQLDGAAKAIVRVYEPRLVRFGTDVPSVWGLSRSAWDMDRSFLVGIDRVTWDSIVADVQQRLSDQVITDAAGRLPPEHFALVGDNMVERLRTRRDRLHEAADQLYRIISEFADIHGTDAAESAAINRIDDDRVAVTIWNRSDSGSATEVRPHFNRTFDRRETREIRLYLHGGDDRVVVRGAARQAIHVRAVGGGGMDGLVDSTTMGGRPTSFYDADDDTWIEHGPGVKLVGRDAKRPRSWGETAALSPDWGTRWLPSLRVPYHSDLGLLVYVGASRKTYAFLKHPYSTQLRVGAGYGPMVQEFVADIEYDVLHIVPRLHGSLELGYSGIERLNYFGLGNATEKNRSMRYYRVYSGLLRIEPSVTLELASNIEFDLRARFERVDTDTLPESPTFVSETRPYGYDTMKQAGAGAALRVDTRNRPSAASSGFVVEAGGFYYPEVLDIDQGAFGRVFGHAATYLSLTGSGNQTAALRVGGAKVWGTFPYYEAAYIGGPETLRGFRTDRFAGDASLYASAEWRMFLGRIGFLIPWDIGVFAISDVGRVYMSGLSPGGWHFSYGGGIWASPFNRQFTSSVSIAFSTEGTSLYAGTGFMF